MSEAALSEREGKVLEAVIRAYVETAEPAGSRHIARRCGLGVSAATVRNTMADLEEKGYLYHPHTSAGRIPTDRAYRFYVDSLMPTPRLSGPEQRRLRRELGEAESTGPLARLLRQTAQALGLLTGELGLASVPRLDDATLQRLELISLSAEKVLVVLHLSGGVVRTVYVDVRTTVPPEALPPVTAILNERLAGRTLREIRETLPERLREPTPPIDASAGELLNVFLQSADELFETREITGDVVHLGPASVLAAQPEFASESRLKSLIELTENRDLLAGVLAKRVNTSVPTSITIGAEHQLPELTAFTLVTSEYRAGKLTGVLGVIGPTRMPYARVTAIVESASALLSRLLSDDAPAR
ncbi:MAG: heat-inducible transcription repressor HrcA [Gemmatimonadetes bacterium]|nr:heat-inducible transcription repressor HrcA [Gemmatimonadota bacterium]